MSIVYVPERYISALNQAEENAVTDYKRKLEAQIRYQMRMSYGEINHTSNRKVNDERDYKQALEWLLRDVLNVSVI